MPNANYSFLERTLHRVALGSNTIAEASFDFEQSLFRPAEVGGRHVFVAGLARSGSTVLMRRFHASGQFRSLQYSDMPFVLMPGMWRRMRGAGRSGEQQQRAHGDGLLVDFESPESLEEVFWRIFTGNRYIRDHYLRPGDMPEDIVERFRTYVGLILATSDSQRYLSKNNNNILRLDTIRKAFPEALLLIPFREPLAQADSLRRQHRRFLEIHQQDKFALQYMQWLGHHEFGGDHRPFVFDDQPRKWTDPEQLEYWLESWVQCYRHLLDTAPKQSVFVGYEALCDAPQENWQTLAKLAQIDAALPETADALENKNRPVEAEINGALRQEAVKIYDRLNHRAFRPI